MRLHYIDWASQKERKISEPIFGQSSVTAWTYIPYRRRYSGAIFVSPRSSAFRFTLAELSVLPVAYSVA